MTLVSKICKTKSQLGTFAADKRNKQSNYNYISADQVLDKIGEAMAKNGIVLFSAITDELTNTTEYTGSRGQAISRYDARVVYEMTLSDGEDEKVMAWVGRGTDFSSPDKAMYKAVTTGHKYFLMKLFNVGIGNDDGEHETPPENALSVSRQQPVTPEQLKALHAAGTAKYANDWDEKRKNLVSAVTKGRATSSKNLYTDEAQRLIDGMKQ